jgi:predicted glycosyltransferase
MIEHRGTILLCPLNWGLGHATRDIPIIKRCMDRGFRVIVASEAPIIELLQKEIPSIETEYFPGANITYSSSNNQFWKLLRQLPSAIYWLFREKSITARLVKKYKPAHIISDNRYGVRHRNVNSILITHQLMLKMPNGLHWLEKPFRLLVKLLVSRFSACWVPDNPLPFSLAGDLVHKYKLPKNALLIGPLSRFMDGPKSDLTNHEHINNKNPQLLVMLSGPEPQRTILQNILSDKIIAEKIPSAIIAGKPSKTSDFESIDDQLQYFSHLETESLRHLIQSSHFIICRAGYTSIMDLWYTGHKAVLIPTPGQTEQEYLSMYHNSKNHSAITQNELKKQSLLKILSSCNLRDDSTSSANSPKLTLNKVIDSL